MTTPSNLVADGAATVALASPVWLPMLHQVSAGAALILPILGAIWLMLQIAFRLHSLFKREKR